MFERTIEAIEPFALTMIILAGANLAGWVQFSNTYLVGVVTVLFGILLMLTHILKRINITK